MIEADPHRWLAKQPVRCPHCAHRYGYMFSRPNKPVTFWEHLIWRFKSLRPEIIVTTIAVTPDGQYTPIRLYADGTEADVYCDYCNKPSPFGDWLVCGAEPIRFIEHWETMCQCGGEMWSEPSYDDRGMMQVCDRCGHASRRAFDM